jgi:hypothetical protein
MHVRRSPAVLGEPPLGFDRGGTAHAGRSDGLTIHVVGAVAGDVNSWDFRADVRAVVRLEIAVVIDFERRRKRFRVRHVSDGHEQSLDRQRGFSTRFAVFDA